MDYVVTGENARRMLRSLRSDRGAAIVPLAWGESVGAIASAAYTPLTEEDCTRVGMAGAPTRRHPLSVIVPDPSYRIGWRPEIESQVISSALPGKPFVRIGSGFSIAGPELLFIDAASTMSFPQLLLFGMELCGTYTHRQSYPLPGRPVYQVEPATSVAKIRSAVEGCSGARLRGIGRARAALPFLMDDSASPMESVLALLLRLPISRGGIAFGKPVLNAEVPVDEALRHLTEARSFHPDIFFERLPIDIEYESEEFHPDLGDWDALDQMSRDAISGKAKRDRQRMRLIQTMGIRVFQVSFDDFRTDAALDALIMQLLKQAEDLSGIRQRGKLGRLMGIEASSRRSRLLESLLRDRIA